MGWRGVERAADVSFKAPELVDQRGLMSAEIGGGCFDAGEGRGDLEPLQPVPTFERLADQAGDGQRVGGQAVVTLQKRWRPIQCVGVPQRLVRQCLR
jgi:hypothetical protein